MTDRNACQPQPIPGMLRTAIPAGIDVVVLRMKQAATEEFLDTARQCRSVCSKLNTPLVVSHRVDIALEVGAEGIHLGQGDPPISEVRQALPPGMLVGYSCHSVAEAEASLGQGADYVFLGPIFSTPEKLKYGDPLGPQVIEAARSRISRTVFIGGMDTGTARVAVEHGASKLAAIRAFQQPPGYLENIRAIRGLLTPGRSQR